LASLGEYHMYKKASKKYILCAGIAYGGTTQKNMVYLNIPYMTLHQKGKN